MSGSSPRSTLTLLSRCVTVPSASAATQPASPMIEAEMRDARQASHPES